MAARRRQLVWLVAAGAALVSQLSPQAWCRECDRPCCVTPERDTPGVATGCPRCAAVESCPVEPPSTPCQCQLDGKREPSWSSARGPTIGNEVVAWAGGPTTAVIMPRSAVSGRDYQAAASAIPIRPPRILYGVWRN